MRKRITVEMLKTKKIDKEKYEKILNNWIEYLKSYIESKKFDTDFLDQLGGAIFMTKYDASERMKVITTLVDKFMTTVFTPKAWEMIKEDLIEEFNTKYEIKELKKE